MEIGKQRPTLGENVVHSRGRLKFSVPLNHPQACMQSTCWWDEKQGVPFGWCPPRLQTIWPGSAAALSFLCRLSSDTVVFEPVPREGGPVLCLVRASRPPGPHVP